MATNSTLPPSALPPIPPNIGSIAASQLIGSLLNYFLYGVLFVQVYVYRLSFPKDKISIKSLVYFVFVFETVQTCLNAGDIYFWFASGYGNLLDLADPHFGPIYTPLMGAVISFIVQIFFCYRIWIIKKDAWWWCIIIGLISLAQTIGGFAGGVEGKIQSDVNKRFEQEVLVYLWLTGAAVADVMIAATMSYLLLSARQQQTRHRNDVVMRIVRLTVETNALSASIAILSLILYAGVPATNYFICPTQVLGKIYANTLLVTFNNRAFIHGPQQNQSSQYSSSHISYDKRSRSTGRSVPFSAGLTLNDTESFTPGYAGNIKVTTHSVTDGTLGEADINLRDLESNKPMPI